MRGVGDELLAGAVELGQAALHLVEGAGELPQLAGGVDRYAVVLDPIAPDDVEVLEREADRIDDAVT